MVPQSDINELVSAYREDGAALTALAMSEPVPNTNIIERLDQTRNNLRVAGPQVANKMGLPR